MPANHCIPHTAEAKAKMSAARMGKPAPWKHRASRVIDGITEYRCGRCALFFPKDLFHADRRVSLGIKSTCKKCHGLVSILSRDKDKKRAAAVISEAKRRARKAGNTGTVTAADVARLREILGGDCLKCGSRDQPTQDHVVPLAKGGLHHPTNLQFLCRPCNEKKQASTADYRSPEQIAAIGALWVVEFKRVTP